MPELPRAGPPGHGRQVPRVPQAGRRAHQGEEGRPPRRRGQRVRGLPRRARGGRRRSPPLRAEGLRPQGRDRVRPRRPPRRRSTARPVTRRARFSASPRRARPATRTSTTAPSARRARPATRRASPSRSTRKGFDHGKTKYPLTGAHAKTPCESCHKTKGEYRIARFAACEDCHKNPHQPALGTCTTCHVTTSFKTLAEGQKFDHAKTGYPLRGRHASVACQTCHVKPATVVRLKYARCADCHQDAAQGRSSPTEDCASCHTETGFKPAKFDHAARHEVPARRQARGHGVRRLPQGGGAAGPRSPRAAHRRLPRREEGMRLLPRRRPQGQARHDVPDLPRDDLLQALDVPASAPARVLPGRARRRRVREVPPSGAGPRGRPAKGVAAPARAAVQGRLVPVRGLPQGPAPRPGGPGLREVPRTRGEGLQGRPLRAHGREVRTHGQARDGPLREVPREGDRDVPRGHRHGRAPTRASRRNAAPATRTRTSASSRRAARPATTPLRSGWRSTRTR